MISQIDAMALASAIQEGRQIALLDVREAWEYQLASIAGSTHIAMSSVPHQIDAIRALQGDAELAIVCHHGSRSMHVAQFLAGQCFVDLLNLRGGIDAWSRQVDPSVPVY